MLRRCARSESARRATEATESNQGADARRLQKVHLRLPAYKPLSTLDSYLDIPTYYSSPS